MSHRESYIAFSARTVKLIVR